MATKQGSHAHRLVEGIVAACPPLTCKNTGSRPFMVMRWCSNTLTVHLGALLKGVFELLSLALSNSSQRDLFRAGGVRDVAVGIAGRRDLVAWGEGVPPGRALWLLRATKQSF